MINWSGGLAFAGALLTWGTFGARQNAYVRRVRRFLALARVVFFVPELARVARCKATSVFDAGLVFLADNLLFFALDS